MLDGAPRSCGVEKRNRGGKGGFRFLRLLSFLCAACILMAGCLPPTPAPFLPTPTETPAPTPTPTATIVWFPATATHTAAPTLELEPTIDQRPALGDVLLRDPFTDQDQWQTFRTTAGSAAYGRDELTLATASSKVLLTSFRATPQLADFYLEIDALPSLCREGDAFGLLLRAGSDGDFYRLMADCAGRLRMERLRSSRAEPLQDWTPTGQVPPGGMIPMRLGVLAQDENIAVFINGVHQFTVRDPVYTSGMIGVFARSAGDTPLTVSFSDLMVYEVGAAPPLPATETHTPQP